MHKLYKFKFCIDLYACSFKKKWSWKCFFKKQDQLWQEIKQSFIIRNDTIIYYMKRTITVYKALFCDMTDNHCRGFAIVALLFIFSVHNGNYHKESHTTSMFNSFFSNTVYSINAVLMCLVLPVIYVIIICIATGIFTSSTPIETPWTLLREWIIVGVFRFTIENCLKNYIKS